jgi:hypothetical protein
MVKDKTGVRMVDAATAIVERGPNCLLQETCTRPTLLKPGKYFIGDLGIAMNENDINEATKCRFASYKAGVYSHRFGKYILPNGRELLIFGTMQGDGTFPGEQRFTDSDGHVYVIDTCAIGITLVEGMPTEFLKRGRIVDFEHEFTCSAHTLQHPQGGHNVADIVFGTKLEFFWNWCKDCNKAQVPTDTAKYAHLHLHPPTGPCKCCGV